MTWTTTRWTDVIGARAGDSPESHAAWARLVETYQPAVFAYFRRSGLQPDAAREESQRFFSTLFRRGDLNGIERGETRFRSWLLRCLDNRRIDLFRQQETRPEVPLPSLDGDLARWEPPASCRSPAQAFERQWAVASIEAALGKLAAQYGGTPRRQALFDGLIAFLNDDPDAVSLAQLATRTELSYGSVRNAIGLLRQQFQHLLRMELGATLEESDDVEDELLYLRRVLSA